MKIKHKILSTAKLTEDIYEDPAIEKEKKYRQLQLSRVQKALESAIKKATAEKNEEAVKKYQERIEQVNKLLDSLVDEQERSQNSSSKDGEDQDKKDNNGEDQDKKDNNGEDQDKKDNNGEDQDKKDNNGEDQDKKDNNGEDQDKKDNNAQQGDRQKPSVKIKIDRFPPPVYPPREPPKENIRQTIKNLHRDSLDGVKKAIQDQLNIDTPIKEDINDQHTNSLMGMSNEAFNELLDDIYTDIDKVYSIKRTSAADQEAKIEKIKADLEDPALKVELNTEDVLNRQSEYQANKRKAKETRQARDIEIAKYANTIPFFKFPIKLVHAVADQVEEYRESKKTFARLDRHHEGENILVKGEWKKVVEDKTKPKIDIFFDRSGSWTSNKTAIKQGEMVIRQLIDFVNQDEIILNIYYFADRVSTDINAYIGFGTTAWDEIMDTIVRDTPTNIILMTDRDMTGEAEASSSITIDGYVWFLWRPGSRDGSYSVCPEITQKLHGKKGSESYVFSSDLN